MSTREASARSGIAMGVAAALITGAIWFAAPGGGLRAQGADYDCADFTNQAQAQQTFISAGGPARDPYRLDADSDGRACESLPCPCSSGGGGSVGGGDEKKSPKKPSVIRLAGRVVDVVDGDTLDVASGGGEVRVRLIGIDTPEVFGGAECGGPEASAAMTRIAEGQGVVLRTDPTQDRRDRYGRLLAYVRTVGAGSLQAAILSEGWARVYVFERRFRKIRRFRAAETSARIAGRGAWGLCGAGF